MPQPGLPVVTWYDVRKHKTKSTELKRSHRTESEERVRLYVKKKVREGSGSSVLWKIKFVYEEIYWQYSTCLGSLCGEPGVSSCPENIRYRLERIVRIFILGCWWRVVSRIQAMHSVCNLAKPFVLHFLMMLNIELLHWVACKTPFVKMWNIFRG